MSKGFKIIRVLNNKFKFVPGHNIDHDNSYIIMRALKNRDKKYINFLSKALNTILKNKK